MKLSPAAFRLRGWDLLRRVPNNTPINQPLSEGRIKREEESFRNAFGVSSDVAFHVWEYLLEHEKLTNEMAKKARPKHLLWSLLFLKQYNTELFLCGILGTTDKTLRNGFGS